MRLNSSQFGKFWRVIPSPPHQGLKQCSYDDLKNAQLLIRIYQEKSYGYRGPNSNSFYEIFDYFFEFFKTNFVIENTGMQYLNNYLNKPIFLLHNTFLKLYQSQIAFTQIWYLHK
jgi:hypothetical protein